MSVCILCGCKPMTKEPGLCDDCHAQVCRAAIRQEIAAAMPRKEQA